MGSRAEIAQFDVLEQLAERVRPVTLADQQVLPVLPALESLLPSAGLQRGSVIETRGRGATSLALAIAAGPSEAGSWTVSVGLPHLGLAAADEMGVDLGRLAVVADPDPARWGSVIAALIGAFDVVLVRAPRRAGANDVRRLGARVRERGTVLVHVADVDRVWPEGPDIALTITSGNWQGLGEGHGHLRARRVEVAATGRRRAAQPRNASLWLPGPDGLVAPVEPTPVALGDRTPPPVHTGLDRRPDVESESDELAELAG